MRIREQARLVLFSAIGLSLVSCGYTAGVTARRAESGGGGATISSLCQSGTVEAAYPAGIVGGEEVPAECWIARSTVAVVQVKRSATGGLAGSTCTGTLISDDIVLTAAHCLTMTGPSASYVLFRDHVDQHNLRGAGVIAIKSFELHPNYVAGEGDKLDYGQIGRVDGRGDIALVQLSRKAPAGYVPVRLLQEAIPWTSFGYFIVAGYGQTSTSTNGDGTSDVGKQLRATTVPVLTDREIGYARMRSRRSPEEARHIFDSGPNAENIWVNQSGGHGVCEGDSGGPSFVVRNGVVYQVGVESAVTSAGDQVCNGLALMTNVRFYQSWLGETFDELEGSRPHQPLFQ